MELSQILAMYNGTGKKVKLHSNVAEIQHEETIHNNVTKALAVEAVKRTRASASVDRKIKAVKSEPDFVLNEAAKTKAAKAALARREKAIAKEHLENNLKQALLMHNHVDAYNAHELFKANNAKEMTKHMTLNTNVKATRRGTVIEISPAFQDTGDALDKRIANCNDLLRSLCIDIVISR